MNIDHPKKHFVNKSSVNSPRSTDHKRFFVVLIDAATEDDDKMWHARAVLAPNEDLAIEIAQTQLEEECGGDGFYPLFTFDEDQFERIVTGFRDAVLTEAKPIVSL